MTVNTNESEEIVLTAGKRGAKAVIRLDRRHALEVDAGKVHSVTIGPYKGLLINKKSQNLENGEPADARLEFLAFLINKEHNNKPLQDLWTLKFWFRGKQDGITKKRTFTQYFQDLMNPEDFPKNYMCFMKKAMLLLKTYHMIKRVELEVEQVATVQTTEITPPIKSFVSLFTPDIYQYNFVPEISMTNKTFLTFMIKAKCDAHIALSANYGELHKQTIEIVIGADSNTRSMIKDGVEGSVRAEALTSNVLNGAELRYFWVSWGEHRIETGRGTHYGEGRFLEWNLPENKRFLITSLAVATDNTTHGQFEFAELLEDADHSKEAKKSRVKRKMMWMANKQRILHCLEDAYPNTLSAAELMLQSVGRKLDSSTMVMMLKELEKTCQAKEVEVGRWMRLQCHQTLDGHAHEIKLVRDMPEVTGKEQPTIAIVTSLFCEKLAVDAMIDEKVTFVKYKTEARRSFVGESQVYTIGTIGRFKVVTTKLSKYPTSSKTARISAENTITRLLGTFNKVEHVFLVGVAGGVPNLSDFSKHCRPGDVTVSIAVGKNNPLYIHCANIDKKLEENSFSYNTISFTSKNKTLQNVAVSLKTIIRAELIEPRPWDIYMDEALEIMNKQDKNFKRPSSDKSIRLLQNSDGSINYFEHPCPMSKHDFQLDLPNVHYGIIGSGKLVARTHEIRQAFADIHNIQAFDLDFAAVLESLEGNRNDSFMVIRGICDYADGTKKEWQPYASLAAAAYMKALIMAL